MKSGLKDNDIDIYSTYFEGKPGFTERSIRTLKNKIHKYITPTSKNYTPINFLK